MSGLAVAKGGRPADAAVPGPRRVLRAAGAVARAVVNCALVYLLLRLIVRMLLRA
ncbi:MAG: hypothetical protein JWM27_1834 [Gemmatimonadetes bacterium]|nr:hypothetical protein [Gemmatimonadota bacterium]